MKILFACHRLPYPPSRGGKIRPFNIIRHFHEQGHQVTVGSLSRSREELKAGQGLRDFCAKLLVGSIGKFSAMTQMVARIPTMSPSSMGYFYSSKLHSLMRAELASQDYDLVFAHCSSAAQYLRASKNVPSVLDFGDMDSQKWLDYSAFKPQPVAMSYWLEGKKMEMAERRLASRFDFCTCTTKAELETLNQLNVDVNTSWFPNGVDTDYFNIGNDSYDPNEICFVGRMDYYPNQQGMMYFCNSVLPLIQRELPDAKLTIVGASPSAEIIALGSVPGVTVTGTVDDVRPHVHKAALTVAPLAIAHGTQNKILESMAMGVPVVSSETAAGGVDAVPGEHILTAADRTEFARRVTDVLRSRVERCRLSEAARKRVIANQNWQSSMRKLDEIVSSVLGRSG